MSNVQPYQTGQGRKWEVRWRDDLGKSRRKKGFPTKKAAQLWQADLEVKTARGEFVDPRLGKSTIGVVAERWRTQQAHLKASTRHNVELWYAHHVEPRWAHRALGSVKPSEVRAWVAEMSTPRPKLDAEGKPVTDEHGDPVMATVGPATIERVVGILRQIFDLAVEDGLLAASPVQKVRVPRRLPPDRPALTHQQVAALVAEIDEHYRVFTLALVYTAARYGELAALRVQDCQLLRRRLHFRRAVTEVKGELVWSSTKTSRERVVPIPASLVEPLSRLMVGKAPGDLVFTTPGGALVRNSVFRPRVFNPAVEAARAKDPTFPDVDVRALRRTGATLALRGGASITAVQALLGHTTARLLTETYAQVLPDSLDQVAQAFEQGLRGPREDPEGRQKEA